MSRDLNSTDATRKKSAVKRIIANIAVGKNVSYLFVDVVKLGPSTDLELKKLVYLYVLSTARLQPEKALLAVNTFLQDTTSASPVVRALAIRTMTCIRVPAVMEYMMEPLRKAIADKDSYVRKTAVMGLGKVFHYDMDIFYQEDFGTKLGQLLNDSTPIVASNAAAIVSEVNDYGTKKIKLSDEWVNRLLYLLPECNEWGQQYILDLIASQRPLDTESTETLIVRVLPRLSHTNPSVVMAAIKVVANLANRCPPEAIERYTIRINAALLTLARLSPEIQYIVCKNIHALLVIFPSLLRTNLDAFYVRFSDPPYVKLEKLRLLLKLVTPSMAPAIVAEFSQYSEEVDMVFVVEVIRSVALLAIKIEAVALDCGNLLLSTLQGRPELLPHVVTAAKDIVRKYPELLMLDTLLENYGAEAVVEEEAKVSLLWMLGEYCDFVENGKQIIERFIDTLMEQEQSAQLAVLSAAVKMFLRNPEEMEPQLNRVLECITTRSDDADVRDRAFAYWRLLSNGVTVEQMKKIVHSQVAPISVDRTFSDAMSMADLKKSVNTAAVIFAKPYQSFLPPYGFANDGDDDEEDEMGEGESAPSAPTNDAVASATTTAQDAGGGGGGDDLFGYHSTPPASSTAPSAASNGGGAGQYVDPFTTLFSDFRPPSTSVSLATSSSPVVSTSAAPPTAAPSTRSQLDDLFS